MAQGENNPPSPLHILVSTRITALCSSLKQTSIKSNALSVGKRIEGFINMVDVLVFLFCFSKYTQHYWISVQKHLLLEDFKCKIYTYFAEAEDEGVKCYSGLFPDALISLYFLSFSGLIAFKACCILQTGKVLEATTWLIYIYIFLLLLYDFLCFSLS